MQCVGTRRARHPTDRAGQRFKRQWGLPKLREAVYDAAFDQIVRRAVAAAAMPEEAEGRVVPEGFQVHAVFRALVPILLPLHSIMKSAEDVRIELVVQKADQAGIIRLACRWPDCMRVVGDFIRHELEERIFGQLRAEGGIEAAKYAGAGAPGS